VAGDQVATVTAANDAWPSALWQMAYKRHLKIEKAEPRVFVQLRNVCL